MGTGITPCPLPSPPGQEGDTSVTRVGEEMEKPRVLPGEKAAEIWQCRDERGRLSCCCLLVHRESSWQEVPLWNTLGTIPLQPEVAEQAKPESWWDQMIWEVSSMLALFLHPSWV